MKSITIGLDISKSVFQVYAEDGAGAWFCRSACAAGR
jgi:hypothetical protein